ncbi:hypothetical protein F5146DRAFT_1170447 [Armillaria mellea]|nr:hypothetical protein F5146DRAFT_1170447 [Armillaria mellea]
MLRDEAREVKVASLRCLSYLILDPNEDEAWFQTSVERADVYHEEARRIVIETRKDWSHVLLQLITETKTVERTNIYTIDEAYRTMNDILLPATVYDLGKIAVTLSSPFGNHMLDATLLLFCFISVLFTLCENAKNGDRSILATILNYSEVLGYNTRNQALYNIRSFFLVLSLHARFEDLFSNPRIFEIVVADMTASTLKIHEGHHIDTQIAGFKCLQKIICYPRVRRMILKGLYTKKLQLFDLLQAFDDEPESSKWLRRRPEYGVLLDDILKRLAEYNDVKEYAEASEDKYLQEKFKEISSRRPSE